MWQQGHGHNYKHDEYTDIDLFAKCLLNTTKSHMLCLLTSSSARQKLCLPLWGLRSYYFSRHDPTQTLASVECLLFNDGDGPPWDDSKVPPGASLQTREPRLRSVVTYRTAAALPSASPTFPSCSRPNCPSLQPLWLSIWEVSFPLTRTHRQNQGITCSLSEPQSKRTGKHLLKLFFLGFFVVAEKEARISV